MLVNDRAHLQSIGTNLAGNYALGRDIDATGGPFTPLGTFTGIFDGSGGLGFNHTISNLTIAPTNPVNVGIGVGLFSAIGFGGTVKNMNFDHASITANPNATGPGQFLGVLAGTNAGTISDVNVTNSTVSSALGLSGVIAGGLVGQNGDLGSGHFGTITLATTTNTNVTVGNAASGTSENNAGGLVGDNPGTITLSSADGVVTGGANSNIGGLVGRNESTAAISNSVADVTVNLTDATGSTAGGLVGFNFGLLNTVGATGDVTGGNSTDIFRSGSIGGLVGMNDAGGTITSGVASGNVTAGSGTSAGGLVGWNNGTINGTSVAAGDVSSVDSFAGGLVGFNGGTITGAIAGGNVSSGGDAGGFAALNSGTITASFALGNVAGTGSAGFSTAGGFVGSNDGTISASFAYGNVTSVNTAGGFVGSNEFRRYNRQQLLHRRGLCRQQRRSRRVRRRKPRSDYEFRLQRRGERRRQHDPRRICGRKFRDDRRINRNRRRDQHREKRDRRRICRRQPRTDHVLNLTGCGTGRVRQLPWRFHRHEHRNHQGFNHAR